MILFSLTSPFPHFFFHATIPPYEESLFSGRVKQVRFSGKIIFLENSLMPMEKLQEVQNIIPISPKVLMEIFLNFQKIKTLNRVTKLD
jgi:hypothetical protein